MQIMDIMKKSENRQGGILLYAAPADCMRSLCFCLEQKETAALNFSKPPKDNIRRVNRSALRRLFFFCRRAADHSKL